MGGLAREFFLRNARFYNASSNAPQYELEPHVAEQLFLQMLAEANVTRVPVAAVAGVRPLARLEGPGWCVDFGAAPGTTTAALAAALPGEAAHHGLTHL